jgi:ABA sandwich protein
MNDLAAGRELDALVAEKVMGWITFVSDYGAPTSYYADPQTGRNVHWEKPNGIIKPFSPSTDIAAAWEVVEQCFTIIPVHQRQFGLNVVAGLDPHPADTRRMVWRCTLRHGTGGEAETAPLAICRAALKAVGHE